MVEDLEEQALGQALVEAGLMSPVQLETSYEYQASLGGKLRDIILKLGFVAEGQLNDVVAAQELMTSIDLSGRTVDVELMRKIPRKVIEKYEAVPLQHTDTTVLLALSESGNFHAVEDIQFLTSCVIETVLAPRSQILELIARFYASEPDQPATESTLAEQLVSGVADPHVQSLAQLLIDKELVDPEEWAHYLERFRR